MAYELVQFSPLQNRLIRKTEAITTVVALIVGWVWSASIGVAIAFAFVGLVISSIVSSATLNTALYEVARKDLAKRGLKVDFQLGNVFIDSKAGVIAFIDLASRTYDLYSTRDILGWEHQWVDKTTASTNLLGDNVRANTRPVSNVLVFKTNNPAKPLYKVPLINHRTGEQWVERLGAIING